MRGVDVRLLLPARNNHPYAGLAGRAWPDLAGQMQSTGTPGEYTLVALAQAAAHE